MAGTGVSVAWAVMRTPQRLLLAALLLLCLLRAGQTVAAALPLGLPGLLGGDFLAYDTAGAIVDSGEVGRLYDLDLQRQVQAGIEVAAGTPAADRITLAFDNPPPAALLFAPLAALPPALAFLLWTLLNLGCLLAVCLPALRREGMPPPARAELPPNCLVFWPVFLWLFSRQMIGPVLLLYALAVRCLERGAEGRAGAALALLAAVKPQYALVLLLIVLVRWRRRALASALGAGAALGLLSLALVGLGGVGAYLAELARLGAFAGDRAYLIDPAAMINWRALLLALAPGLPDGPGLLLTNALAAATVLAALAAWRGPWRPGMPLFRRQVLAATAAVLLAAYHSHIHGAALLLVPFLLFLEAGELAWPLPRALAAAAFLPPALLFLLLGPAALAVRWVASLWLIGCLLAALAYGLRRPGAAASSRPGAVPAPAALGTAVAP